MCVMIRHVYKSTSVFDAVITCISLEPYDLRNSHLHSILYVGGWGIAVIYKNFNRVTEENLQQSKCLAKQPAQVLKYD